MGTGKSTVGRILAGLTGRTFVDTDSIIERGHGPIHEIFETRGEAGFRDLERVAASELAATTGQVIATGGRLMLDPANIAAFSAARVFALVADAEEIHRRIVDGHGPRRPLLEVDDPLARIRALLNDRRAGYERFPRIQSAGRSPNAVAVEIAELTDRGTLRLQRDAASIVLGVGEAMRWRRYAPSGGHSVRYSDPAANRWVPLIGEAEENASRSVVVVGGLPPDTFALYIPTELSALLWWATLDECTGHAVFDVGLVQDDRAGITMLDQYLTEVAKLDVPRWAGGSGTHPRLLGWLLESVEAVCRDAGFVTA